MAFKYPMVYCSALNFANTLIFEILKIFSTFFLFQQGSFFEFSVSMFFRLIEIAKHVIDQPSSLTSCNSELDEKKCELKTSCDIVFNVCQPLMYSSFSTLERLSRLLLLFL